jgi:hypothetical protein
MRTHATAVQIAPLAAQDIDSCAALMASSEPWTRYGITGAGAHALWAQALAEGATAWVARHDETACGFAWYIARGAFGLSGYLKLLSVSAAVRGQDDLFLLVSHFNLAAQRFYEAHGYRRLGAIADYVRPGVTELIYHKRLSEN